MKIKENFKRFVTGTLSLTIFAMFQLAIPAYAQHESEEFKYTMFASSNEEGAITVNSDNFTINGQIATNGTIDCRGNNNINYETSNNACVEMIYIPNKINSDFFDGKKIDCVEEDYSIEETNINISSPLSVEGITTIQGNISIQAGVKSKDDIYILGDVQNTSDTVIYSQYGDINIDCNNVSLNGLIYAPFGVVNITASNLNMNNTMIIANKIIIDAPNVNINYSEHFGSYFNEVSDKMEIPEEDFCYLEDLNNNNIPDFFENSVNWKYLDDTDGDGVPDIIEINTGTDPNVFDNDMNDILDNYTLEMMYKNPLILYNMQTKNLMIYGDMNNDLVLDAFDLILMRKACIDNEYYEYADLDSDGDLDAEDLIWLSNYLLSKVRSFPVYMNFDSDNDGLSDYTEIENYGTSPHKADTDGDGLNDYFELFLMKTDPLIPDNIAGEDPDNDGLTNAQESKYNTDPYSEDTDNDGLTDSREIELGTDPLSPDTDGDGLSDYDEVEVLKTLDPLNANTNGTPDKERIFNQVITVDDPILSNINTDDNAYNLSLEINASGNAKKLLNIEKSGYNNAMKDGSALGFIPEFSYPDDFKVKDITLKFEIKEKYRNSVIDLFSENYGSVDNPDLEGIKRFNIFKYFEEIDMAMPIDTICNVDTNTISVTITSDSFESSSDSVHEIGSYALVDLEIWSMLMNGNLIDEKELLSYDFEINSVIRSNINTTSIYSRTVEDMMDIFENYSKHKSANTIINDNYEPFIVGGHVYAVINNSSQLSWETAKTKCENMGGHLMTINSSLEYSALRSYFTTGKTTNRYWLGASGSGRNWQLVNNEGSAEYLKSLRVNIDGHTYGVSDFNYIGTKLYYADGLSYYTNKSLAPNNATGYICEWDSYSEYRNNIKNIVATDSSKQTISSFGGSFILKGLLSATNNIDTDNDGVPDYKELNWKLLHNINGKTSTKTTITYLDILNWLSANKTSKNIISKYQGSSKINKALNQAFVTTTSSSSSDISTIIGTQIAPTVKTEVIAADNSIIYDDFDGDYIPDSEDKDRKFNPTPVDMVAIDDSDMFEKTPMIDKSGNGTTVVQPDYIRMVSEKTIGGGINELIDMNDNHKKVATNYIRDNENNVEFLVNENKNASCIIAEVEFDSKSTRDSIYECDDFLRFYKKVNKSLNLVIDKEKIDNSGKYIIKYTLATNDNLHYVLKIDSQKLNAKFSVKVYEETYVYAPNGGMLYSDSIYKYNKEIHYNYKKLYLDELTFKNISGYNGIDNGWNFEEKNIAVASVLAHKLVNKRLEDFEFFNELINDSSLWSTYSGGIALLINFSDKNLNSLNWDIVGAIITGIGIATTTYCSFNTINEEILKNDLIEVLNKGNFNICYTMYNNTELPMSLNAEWASWDGKYINRIKENTVLHISLVITGCNIQDGSEVDLSKLKHEDN